MAAAQNTNATTNPAPAVESQRASTPSPAQRALTREEQILSWVRGPEPASAETSPAQVEGTGNESPPDPETSGADPDLSQSPPNPEAQHTGPAAETAGGEDPPAGEERADAKGRWPTEAVERLRKLKDQRNKAREEAADKDRQLAELTQKVQSLEASLKSGRPEAGPVDTVETLGDVESLRARVQDARNVGRWAEEQLELVGEDEEAVARNLDAYGIKAPDGGWDAKTLRTSLRGIRDRTRVVVEEAAPRRYHWLQREAEVIGQVNRVVPELADPQEPLQEEVAALLQTYPGLKQQPDWLHLATIGAWGMREWRKRAGEAGKPAAPKSPPPAKPLPKAPRLPGAPKAVAPEAGNSSEIDVLRERAMRPGATARDREAYIRAQL